MAPILPATCAEKLDVLKSKWILCAFAMFRRVGGCLQL